NDGTLSFDENDLRISSRLEYEVLRWTGDEVCNHGIHRVAPSLDQDSGLTGRYECDSRSARAHRVTQLQLRCHLADVAVRSHGEDDRRAIVHLADAAGG